jgi:hypothetical protein
MADLHRRTILRGAAAAAGGALVGGPFAGFAAQAAHAEGPGAARHPGGRPPVTRPTLGPVPDQRDGAVRLWLPQGFAYRSFHDTTNPVTLDDGTRLPGRHDGMGAFRGRGGTVRLVRNHELNGSGRAFGDPAHVYDPAAPGGTTTVEVTRDGQVRRAYASLGGTQMNCSGGRMPWGSWITCEETVNGPDVGPDFTNAPNTPLTKPHGFIFEVPADGHSNARPITRAGRFAHESVAFEPFEGVLYLTEDDFGYASGFYRYKPRRHPLACGYLDDEGRLQMLAVRGQPNANLAGHQRPGASYKVEWVDIEEPARTFPYTPGQPASTPNDVALTFVARQGWAKGAAYFSRLEGSVYDRGVVYFCSTQGGGEPEVGTGPIANGYGNGYGQVWAYHVWSRRLELVYQSPGPEVLDFPDNVTTSPRGTLVLCEDSGNDNYVRGLTPSGQLFDVALNRLFEPDGTTKRWDDEFAGSTFSPDGHTLYVNIQASKGITFAIWGPWRNIGI